jgi:hypothetical protein
VVRRWAAKEAVEQVELQRVARLEAEQVELQRAAKPVTQPVAQQWAARQELERVAQMQLVVPVAKAEEAPSLAHWSTTTMEREPQQSASTLPGNSILAMSVARKAQPSMIQPGPP